MMMMVNVMAMMMRSMMMGKKITCQQRAVVVQLQSLQRFVHLTKYFFLSLNTNVSENMTRYLFENLGKYKFADLSKYICT